MSERLLPCPFCGGEAEPIQELLMQRRAYIICSDHNCWGHMKVEWGTMDDKDKFIKRLIENWNRRADRWIPVTERLPESGDTVLAYIKHNYSDTDGWRAYRAYEYTDHWVGMGNLCEVIVWMPLPEPPEGWKEGER